MTTQAPSKPQTSAGTERPDPHNLDAERAVLGSVLIDNRLIATVRRFLKPDCFYEPSHRAIFEAMCDLETEGVPIDPTTLCNRLAVSGELEISGGPPYMARLEGAVLSTSNVESHALVVRDKALKRRLIRATRLIKDQTAGEEGDAEDLLARAQEAIFSIQREHVSQAIQPISQTAHEVVELIDQRRRLRHHLSGLSSGYSDFDDLTSGFQRSDLIILAGRTSMGKTAFALNLGLNIAAGQRKPILIFSLEMSRHSLCQRLISLISGVPMELMRMPKKLSPKQFEDIAEGARKVGSAQIYIDDTPGIDIADIRARARYHKAQNPELALVIVDYLQLVTDGAFRRSSKDSRQVEVSRISGSLKGVAREVDVPLIALAQLSRQVEQRRGKDKLPMLSDLRESGAIEQDADLVMFIHRPRYYERGREDDESKVEDEPYEEAKILIRKHRNGRVGDVPLLFHGPTTRFVPEQWDRPAAAD